MWQSLEINNFFTAAVLLLIAFKHLNAFKDLGQREVQLLFPIDVSDKKDKIVQGYIWVGSDGTIKIPSIKIGKMRNWIREACTRACCIDPLFEANPLLG